MFLLGVLLTAIFFFLFHWIKTIENELQELTQKVISKTSQSTYIGKLSREDSTERNQVKLQ